MVVVFLVAAGLGWVRHGGDGGKVVTGPGAPAVQLPKVGLPGRGNQWSIAAYSPGRWESIYLLPAGTPVGTGPYTLLVAPDAAAHLSLPTSPGSTESARVRGAPATVIAITSDRPVAAVVWEIGAGSRGAARPGWCACRLLPDAERAGHHDHATGGRPRAGRPPARDRREASARSATPSGGTRCSTAGPRQHEVRPRTGAGIGRAPRVDRGRRSCIRARQVVEDLDAPRLRATFRRRQLRAGRLVAVLAGCAPAASRCGEHRASSYRRGQPRPVRSGVAS